MNTYLTPLAGAVSAPPKRTLRRLGGLALVVAALQVACASMPAPTAQLAVASAAVDSAVRAGAAELAPTELAVARDKLARANASMVETKYERALMMAEAAQVDARLAEVRSRSATAAKAATAVREDNRVLRQEIERGTAK